MDARSRALTDEGAAPPPNPMTAAEAVAAEATDGLALVCARIITKRAFDTFTIMQSTTIIRRSYLSGQHHTLHRLLNTLKEAALRLAQWLRDHWWRRWRSSDEEALAALAAAPAAAGVAAAAPTHLVSAAAEAVAVGAAESAG